MWGFVRRLLNRDMPRPDLWALNLRCVGCSWRTTPAGPWRVRDALVWPERCPVCGADVIPVLPDCPRCDRNVLPEGHNPQAAGAPFRELWSMMRVPRRLGEALWGHFRCPHCGCLYDKWGREVGS